MTVLAASSACCASALAMWFAHSHPDALKTQVAGVVIVHLNKEVSDVVVPTLDEVQSDVSCSNSMH